MVSPAVQQLEDQQALLTQALRAALEGNWCDAPPSVQAFVLALDPSLEVSCVPPYRQTDIPPPPPSYLDHYDPNTAQYRQSASWTCSACSLAWLERALGLNPYADEWSAVAEIGQPENINPTYGLMDGSGAQLRRVLNQYGQNSSQAWLSFDTAYAYYSQTPGMMSGGAIYHWVGVRGITGDGQLWVANSAPGYCGVYDTLSREQFNTWGPWSCVWCTA